MQKYSFCPYKLSEYQVDPVFKSKDFTLFGDPEACDDGPDLFEVYINTKRFKYCLVHPDEIKHNEEFLLKIRRYLLAHEDNKNLESVHNTYFIGDMKKSVDISSGFTNQNIILVTYEMIEQWYPKTISDIFRVIIKSVLYTQKHLGQHNSFNSIDDDVLFVDPKLNDGEKRDYKMYLQRCMAEEGLISIVNDGFRIDCFVLTAKAIDMVQNTKENENKSAFIAIKFDENEERINAIQNAIAEAGFEPIIMNKLETNNWIMPEIFYQIENSRFVVADFSLACDGAYYEAGYATALKKPVIHLFDKREERDDNKLHFDIAQKSTIFYENYDDLRNRLIDRINATIRRPIVAHLF